MKYAFGTTVLALALGLAGSISHAQQAQQFGRDSLYALPGPSETHSTPPVAADAPVLQPYGRDSVYASRQTAPTTPVASDAARMGLRKAAP